MQYRTLGRRPSSAARQGRIPTRREPRGWIMTAVQNSLRRLQTDYIDLYQVHRRDPDTDIEDTLSALSDLIQAAALLDPQPRHRTRGAADRATHGMGILVWGPLAQGTLVY